MLSIRQPLPRRAATASRALMLPKADEAQRGEISPGWIGPSSQSGGRPAAAHKVHGGEGVCGAGAGLSVSSGLETTAHREGKVLLCSGRV